MKTKFKIKWKFAVDWDYHISLDIQMLIVEWLFKSGRGYQQRERWGYSGVFEMLITRGCVNCQQYGRALPVWEENGLRKIINRAVLKGDALETCARWRRDLNINYEGSRIISETNNADSFPFGIFDNPMEDQLKILKGFIGKSLNFSPNQYWPLAKTITAVEIRISPSGLICLVEYGDAGGGWELARYPRGNQYIPDWIDKIIRELEQMTKPEGQR